MSKPHDEPEMHIIIKDRMGMSDFSLLSALCSMAWHGITPLLFPEERIKRLNRINSCALSSRPQQSGMCFPELTVHSPA